MMKKVTSLSGGMSSAMCEEIAPADKLVFALVRSENPVTLFPDEGIRKLVEQRIGKEFIGTLEDNLIIRTMLDLEQRWGKKINWVSGITYEELIIKKNGYLPNIKDRFCTTWLKIDPIFHWWHKEFNAEPVEMSIGYRFGEGSRVQTQINGLNKDGLSEYKATLGKWEVGRHIGRNKWETIAWRKPVFPLFNQLLDKSDVMKHWKGTGVYFAEHNNCVGCFHRSPNLLNYMSKKHPNQFAAFIGMENNLGKGTFKKNISYEKIKDMNFTMPLFGHDLDQEGCSSGFCGF